MTAGTRLWRVYSAGGPHAVAWNEFRQYGPTDSRFDPQRPPTHFDSDRAVCYLGEVAPLCVAERFQAHRRVERRAGDPHLAGFDLRGPVRLLDLRGLWPTRMGASQAVATGPRSRSRRWAVLLYETVRPDVDGLCYRSSMYGGQTAVALWDRARPALPSDPVLDIALSDPRLTLPLARSAWSVGYSLA